MGTRGLAVYRIVAYKVLAPKIKGPIARQRLKAASEAAASNSEATSHLLPKPATPVRAHGKLKLARSPCCRK